MEIRAATVDDRAAVARLLAAHHAERGDPVAPDDIARAVELALAPRALAWLVVASRGGLVVGVALANPVITPAHGGAALRVESIYVPPAHRRRGVGRALLGHLLAEARTAGMRTVELDFRPDDHAALALSHLLGFSIAERFHLTRTT